MKKVGTPYIGIVCVVLLFLTGFAFNAPALQTFICVLAALVLTVTPAYYHLRKVNRAALPPLRPEEPQRQAGPAEYASILFFVAILVTVVFQFTESYIDAELSTVMDGYREAAF